MTVIIDHERFGLRVDFRTVAEAQCEIRECGPEFSTVALEVRGDEIYDERGDRVGFVSGPTTLWWTATMNWCTGQRDRRDFAARAEAEAWVREHIDATNVDRIPDLQQTLRTIIDITVRGCRDSAGTVAPVDGSYFFHPAGGVWSCFRMQDGRPNGSTDESQCGSHDAARDEWAGVRPEDADEMVPDELANALVSAAFGRETDPTMVIVSYRKD